MPGLCPSDDVLGALVQQVLGGDESECVRSHIDECAACAQVVIAAVRGRATRDSDGSEIGVGTPSPSQPARGELPVGSKIARYDVRELLGIGGMGHVYAAYDAELDRAIALKVLRPDLAIAQELADRLVRESRLMAKISHPAVITVHDVGREDDTVFVAMELIRGETLGAYVARKRPPWRIVLELYERAGAGLAAAHRAGVVHRDFKPDNVLVELDRGTPARVVVTDFGVALATSIVEDNAQVIESQPADPRMTQPGTLLGTPAYMAPEQLAGESVDRRADVFAFCVSLWEALFGERPFHGTTVGQIRRSMKRSPRPRRRAIPRGLVRTLARGLAIDPRDRPQDMSELLRELARVQTRHRRVGSIAAIGGLVAVGAAIAVLVPSSDSTAACARETLHYDMPALRAAIANPVERDEIVAKVDAAAAAWRQTQAATCKPDRQPAQPPRTAACLDARRLEITAFVDDAIRDRGAHARDHVAIVGDPTRCVEPAPGLLTAHVPTDIALRRRVTALRDRAFATHAMRSSGELEQALAVLEPIAREAEATWPFVHAEVLYLIGTTQAVAGDTQRAPQTLRRAAAVAEAAHHDDIAAQSWIQLAISATSDEGAPGRGLEYATYAAAALERLAWPPSTTSLFEYAKGTALTKLSRLAEAEASLRRAFELAHTHALDTLAEASLGLGYLYEAQGRYADALGAYRDGLDKVGDANDTTSTSAAIIFRQRLAINFALLGNHAEAERLAREALRIAEQRLTPEHVDRAIIHGTLAQVLLAAGRDREALEAIHTAQRLVVQLEGERSALYGELTKMEADILGTLGRFAESARRFERSCDILAFHTGDDSIAHAECSLAHAIAVHTSGELRGALALVEAAAPVILAAYAEPHPQIANTLVTRGTILLDLGRRDAAVADLERAVSQLEKLELDPGHLAGAQFALAKALWPRERDRARTLLDRALATFDTASAGWERARDEARALRAVMSTPARR